MGFDIFAQPLQSVVTEAWNIGKTIDLTGVGYGRAHWGDGKEVITTPFDYYYFLAGISRLTGARRVLEVGTHQGGSTQALLSGLVAPNESRIVTFDTSAFGAEIFAGHPVVRAYTMDGNSQGAVEACIRDFDGTRIDMAFIDSTHDFWTTLQSIALYGAALCCPLIVLDDVKLNDSMARLWSLLRDRYGHENTIDASDVHPEIRRGGGDYPGFGIIRQQV
jgi:hypothetical protein